MVQLEHQHLQLQFVQHVQLLRLLQLLVFQHQLSVAPIGAPPRPAGPGIRSEFSKGGRPDATSR